MNKNSVAIRKKKGLVILKKRLNNLLREHQPYLESFDYDFAPRLGKYNKDRIQLLYLNAYMSDEWEDFSVSILPRKEGKGYIASINTNCNIFFQKTFPDFTLAYDYVTNEYLGGEKFRWYFAPDYAIEEENEWYFTPDKEGVKLTDLTPQQALLLAEAIQPARQLAREEKWFHATLETDGSWYISSFHPGSYYTQPSIMRIGGEPFTIRLCMHCTNYQTLGEDATERYEKFLKDLEVSETVGITT